MIKISNLFNTLIANILAHFLHLSKNFPQTRSSAVTLLGVLTIAIFAQISIPLHPIPINLSTVAVMLIGFTYSSTNAFKVTTLYLILGASGLPIFSNFGGGLNHILGPKGGYIVGFIPSAYLLALTLEKFKTRRWLPMAAFAAIATLVTYICGVSWLSHFIGFNQAIQLGLLPFIIPGMVKILILVSMLKIIKSFHNYEFEK